MGKNLNLYYSRIGSIPILGSFFYLAQLVLLFGNLTNRFYMSGKDKKILPAFIPIIENEISYLVCRTVRIGHPLENFTKPLHIEVTKEELSYVNLNMEKNYQFLIWTLSRADSMNRVTKNALMSTFQLDFEPIIPVKEII